MGNMVHIKVRENVRGDFVEYHKLKINGHTFVLKANRRIRQDELIQWTIECMTIVGEYE
jgi:hypothetical protein